MVDHTHPRRIVRIPKARGNRRGAGSWASVMRLGSLRTLLALATSQDLDIIQFNITSAYLHGDVDWGGDLDDRGSVGAYVVKIGCGGVSWKSRKQTCVALSSTQAEYVALCQVAKESKWMVEFLKGMGISTHDALEYLSMKGMLADLLTKPSPRAQRQYLARGIGVFGVSDVSGSVRTVFLGHVSWLVSQRGSVFRLLSQDLCTTACAQPYGPLSRCPKVLKKGATLVFESPGDTLGRKNVEAFCGH